MTDLSLVNLRTGSSYESGWLNVIRAQLPMITNFRNEVPTEYVLPLWGNVIIGVDSPFTGRGEFRWCSEGSCTQEYENNRVRFSIKKFWVSMRNPKSRIQIECMERLYTKFHNYCKCIRDSQAGVYNVGIPYNLYSKPWSHVFQYASKILQVLHYLNNIRI